jgi:hypothetical protein
MSRIVPTMESDTIPVTGVDDLENHLNELLSDTTLALQAKLFDDVELQLTGKNHIQPSPLPFLHRTAPFCPVCYKLKISICIMSIQYAYIKAQYWLSPSV